MGNKIPHCYSPLNLNFNMSGSGGDFDPDMTASEAAERKVEGNRLFKAGRWREAREAYSEALL